jgi:hypothetical protein
MSTPRVRFAEHASSESPEDHFQEQEAPETTRHEDEETVTNEE